MAQTNFTLPAVVVANPSGTPTWQDPDNILLLDGDFAVSEGPTNILTVSFVGNVNLNVGDAVTNIVLELTGYRGSFNTTLQIYAIDSTTGVEFSYPYFPPYQSFTGTNTTHVLTPTLFGTTWSVDQINNIQLRLVADGELHLDGVRLSVQYVPAGSPIPPSPSPSGEAVCHEYVQAQPFYLSQAMTDASLYAFVSSFTYSNGELIQITDFSGGSIEVDPDDYGAFLVIDQGKPNEETIRIQNIEHDYNGTGETRLTIGTILNRGLLPKYPYTHDVNNVFAHGATHEVVISNSAAWYDRFLKKCQIDALVSAPIAVEDESVTITNSLHRMDFRGAGVQVTTDVSDPAHDVIVTIPGSGINPPAVATTSSATTGNAQAGSLTWSHVSSGINRLLVVQVGTEAANTITGITYNGVALTQRTTTTLGTLRQEQWTLTAPPVGTYDIVVTMSAPSYITAGAETYVTVNQTTPTGATQTATGTGLTPVLVLATTVDNSLVVDGLVTGTLPIVYTVDAGQTENWHITVNPNTRQGASSVEPAGSQPDNVVMSWSITQSIPWALTALEIIGIGSTGGGSVNSVTDDGNLVVVVDNTDPVNPVIGFNGVFVDGVSITGDGTSGNPLVSLGGGGSSTRQIINQTPDNGTYGLLAGAVDGVNTTFTVSTSEYVSGTLQVYLNGLIQLQGATDDWQETTPAAGTFDFNIAPQIGDIITVSFQETTSTSLLEVEENGVSVETGVVVINFTGNVAVTNPAPGQVDVDIQSSTVSSTNTTFFEDFCGYTSDTTIGSDVVVVASEFWSEAQIGDVLSGQMMASESNHPGIIELGTAGNWAALCLGDGSLNTSFDFTKSFEIETLVRITNSGIAQADYFIGLLDGTDPTGNNERIGILGNDGGTSVWVGQTASGVATTNSGSTAALARATWYKLKITFDGTTAEFFVDGVSLGTIITTLPTGQGNLVFSLDKNAGGGSVFLEVDYISFNYQTTR